MSPIRNVDLATQFRLQKEYGGRRGIKVDRGTAERDERLGGLSPRLVDLLYNRSGLFLRNVTGLTDQQAADLTEKIERGEVSANDPQLVRLNEEARENLAAMDPRRKIGWKRELILNARQELEAREGNQR